MNFIILAGSLLVLYVYGGFKGKNNYFTKRGFVLLALIVILVVLKIKSTGAGNLVFSPKTAGLFINGAVTAVGIATLHFLKKRKVRLGSRKMALFFLLYIPLAFLEQILFLFVFAETFFHVTGNMFISSLITSAYYHEFHQNRFLGKHIYLMYIISFIWTITYLRFGSIVLPTLSMAILGPLYYSFLAPRKSDVFDMLNLSKTFS